MTSSIFDLAEITMTAGASRRLTFAVYDTLGSAVSLSGATITWYLSHYGDATAVVTKTGTSGSATNQFVIDLVEADTTGFSGTFIQQYKMVDASGSTFRPSNGIIKMTQNTA